MLENIGVAIGIITLVSVIGLGVYNFIKLGKDKQLDMVRQWLLLAVVEAEKLLGDGTGQIKLRYVYDLFIDKFKLLALILPFEKFSEMVDEALDIMRDMLANNQQLKEYIEK